MSTIAIVKKGNTVSIASDSICMAEGLPIDGEMKTNNQKIYAVNDCFVGLTGCHAMVDIFESLIDRHSSMMDFTNRKSIFYSLQAVQRLLLDVYHVNTKEGDDQPVHSSRLNGLAISSKGIFSFNSYRNVSEYSKFWASGTGMNFALGAMQARYDNEDDPEIIAQVGVIAACSFDTRSSLPVQFASIELDPVEPPDEEDDDDGE